LHKGVILLIKEKNKNVVKAKVTAFMRKYGDGRVWDWYVIGGRWARTLNPLTKPFFEEAKKILNTKDGFLSQQEVDNKKPELQALWEKMGGKDTNPYNTDQYYGEYNDDIIPLKDCLETVKEWKKYTDEELPEKEKRAEEYKAKKDMSMYGYMLRSIGNLYSQYFCFDCSMFNTEDYDYSIPKDIENYYAVMIDMHN